MWDLSCRFKCSRRANDLVQVAQIWGLGLSVFGGGNCAALFDAPFNDLACGRTSRVVSHRFTHRRGAVDDYAPLLLLSLLTLDLSMAVSVVSLLLGFSMAELARGAPADGISCGIVPVKTPILFDNFYSM